MIERRFRGPAASANGGYTCGRLAALVAASAVEVTLRAPPPLERPLRVEHRGDRVLLLDESKLVAEAVAAPAPVELEVPRSVTVAEAAAAEAAASDDEHAFPECFVCGPAREPGDALRLRPGRLGDEELVAAVWAPHPSLAGEDGSVRREFVWAALDCPGAFAVEGTGRGMTVLGRLAARIDEPPRVGGEYVVLGWPRGGEGRKHEAGTALLAPTGQVLAYAQAVWIEPRAA